MYNFECFGDASLLVPHWDVLSIAWKGSKYRFWVCSNDLILRTSPLWRFSVFFSKWCSKYLSVAIHYTTPHYITVPTTTVTTTLPYTTLHHPTLHCGTLITPPQTQLQLHYTNYTTPQLQHTTTPLHYYYSCTTPHYIEQLWVRWPTRWPLQPLM